MNPATIGLMTVCILAEMQSAHADLLLLGDDFTVTGTPNSEDANYNVALRQTGAVAPSAPTRSTTILSGGYAGVGSFNGLHNIDNLTITAVPEAGTTGLLGLALLILRRLRRAKTIF